MNLSHELVQEHTDISMHTLYNPIHSSTTELAHQLLEVVTQGKANDWRERMRTSVMLSPQLFFFMKNH